MALALASCWAPMASMDCTKVGMPVGMAETAIEMPSSIRASKLKPRTSPTTRISARVAHATIAIFLVRSSSCSCSGERVRETSLSMEAIRPTSVLMPVSVITIVAVPRVTDVFWNSMLDRSPRAMSAPSSPAGSLPTGTLSPVRADSCASSVADSRMRPSAGTMSPASTCTTSPGTRSDAGRSVRLPSRITRACGTWRLASASTLARALSSWLVPITTLSRTRAITTAAVEPCPITMLTTATASSIRVMGSASWPSAIRRTEGLASCCSVFGTVPDEPFVGVGRGQPRRRRVEPGEYLRPRHQVPCGLFGAGRVDRVLAHVSSLLGW